MDNIAPGPLKDRIAQMGDRLETAVDEAWRIAQAGQSLSAGRAQMDTDRVHAELAATRGAPPTERSAQTIAALEAQLASAERLDRTIADAYDRLRLLDARIDESVTRAIELSVTQTDVESVSVWATRWTRSSGRWRPCVRPSRRPTGPAGPGLPS